MRGLKIELERDIVSTVKSLGMWGEGRREDIIKAAKKKDKTPQEYLIEALEKRASRYTGHFMVIDVPVFKLENLKYVLDVPLNNYKEFFQTFKHSFGSEQRLIPFFRLPFVKYDEATLDLEEPGQLRGIMHNDFNRSFPHIHYKGNCAVANVVRPGLVGKLIN